jgi:O-antigen/teichoic acid export membrane protein
LNNKSNQLGAGVLLSYLGQAIQILLTLFYTPVMRRLLGQSEYGVYEIVVGVVGMLSLLTLGFGQSYIKHYSDCRVKEDGEREVARLNGLFLLVFSVLGTVVLILGGVLYCNAEAVLGSKLSMAEMALSRRLLLILAVNSALNFPLTVYNNYIIAHEKFIPLQFINLFATVLNPGLSFPLLLLGFGSMGMSVAMLCVTLGKLVISVLYCHIRLKMRFSFRQLRFGTLRIVFAFSFYIFIDNIASTINVGVDRFLLGRMIGAVAAAVYAVGGQINTLYISLSTAISSVFTPRVNRMVAEGCSDKALSGVFIRVGKIQFGTLLLILSGFAVFGRRFMSFWAGEGYEESFFVALILLCGYTVDLIQNVGIEIQRAKGYQKYRSLVNSIAAALNLGVSILLIPKLGATGAAIGTAVIWTVSCGLVTNLIYAKVISLSVGRFWREILRMSVGGILPLALGVVALPLINTCPLPIYFLLIAAFVLLYACSMYLLGLRRSERAALVTSLGRFALRRVHHQDTEV